MGLDTVIGLGPLQVPLWTLMIVAAYLGALLSLRIALPDRREERSRVGDTITLAFLIGFLGWKLTPGLLNPGVVIREPLYLLYATGGVAGTVVAVIVAGGYLAFSTRRLWRASSEDRRTYLRGGVAFLAGAVATAAVFSLVTALSVGDDRSDVARAPDFTLVTLEGEEVALSDYRGRTVILNFWATWCPPCRAELPVLVEFHKRLGEAGTGEETPVLLGINRTSSESSYEALVEFVEEHDIEFPVLLDTDDRVSSRYGVRGIPTTYVVGADGSIVARRTGVVGLDWLERF